MSQRKRRKKSRAAGPGTSNKRKVSEMISEFAGDFIGLGDTADEQQSRLNAACSAWNMACAPPEVRRQQLAQYMDGYRRFNPATSEGELAEIRSDLESLVERKLRMFPTDHRQVVDARIVPSGQGFRIEVASATLG